MTDKPTPECLTCNDHGAVGNILTAEPCPDCTRWNVQPAPATQQAEERVYAFRRKGLDDFCTCDEARYEELSNKPHLFETRIFYTAPQPSHGQAPAGAAEEIDKALNVYAQAFAARVNGWTRQNGDDLPGARSALFAAIHAYAQASTRPTTSPQADNKKKAPL